MYQNLGLFITIIVTLVGGVATWMSYVARKSVHEFIQEWSKKLESVENEMKESLKRLRDLVGEAEGSANKAAKHAQSIEDSEKVLNKTLESVDNLRAYVASLDAQQRGEQAAATHPQPIAEAAPVQPSSEPQAADEDADVTSRLKGKINPAESEGPKP
jgi:peptidoglycan hydrolase CwlO-like protein